MVSTHNMHLIQRLCKHILLPKHAQPTNMHLIQIHRHDMIFIRSHAVKINCSNKRHLLIRTKLKNIRWMETSRKVWRYPIPSLFITAQVKRIKLVKEGLYKLNDKNKTTMLSNTYSAIQVPYSLRKSVKKKAPSL